jgi:hypothetical protein
MYLPKLFWRHLGSIFIIWACEHCSILLHNLTELLNSLPILCCAVSPPFSCSFLHNWDFSVFYCEIWGIHSVTVDLNLMGYEAVLVGSYQCFRELAAGTFRSYSILVAYTPEDGVSKFWNGSINSQSVMFRKMWILMLCYIRMWQVPFNFSAF